MTSIPHVALPHGIEMPVLGLGVYKNPPKRTAAAVEAAIRAGYRLIDTAAMYLNERQVAEGIQASGIERAELFISTKLWITQYGAAAARDGFERSLDRLDLDYLDLYLLHWPMPSDFEATVASWRTLEALRREGRVRAIGVCNFEPDHLDALIERTGIVPAVNQVELHPFFTQPAVRAANRRHGIHTQSWSPIGGAVLRNPDAAAAGGVLAHPAVLDLAATYGRTPAQVVLRWHLDQGLSAIPKSVDPARIAENLHVFGFALTEEDIGRLAALDTGRRSGSHPDEVDRSAREIDLDAQ